MNLLREYIKVLLEQEQGSKGNLVVVDVQPEYESNTPFDIGDMLRTAAEDYSRVLFLFNGEDTLGMVSESALKNFYFEKLDYDEELFDDLLSKSTFFDKGYGFFRDVMDSSVCFDRASIVKIVKHMIDNDIRDIRDLEEEDIESIGVSELLIEDLEDYGFWIPDLEDELPSWSGSDLAGGARNECMAEVEILGAAQGLSFNHVNQFIYEGDNRYTEPLLEISIPGNKEGHFKILIPPPPPISKRLQELNLISNQYNNSRHTSDDIKDILDRGMVELYDTLLKMSGKGSHIGHLDSLKKEIKPIIHFHKRTFNAARPHELAAMHDIPFQFDYLKSAQTPSYPSGHTTQAFYVAIKLSKMFPDLKEHFFSIANKISESRIDRGVHFPSDNAAGKMLAAILAEGDNDGVTVAGIPIDVEIAATPKSRKDGLMYRDSINKGMLFCFPDCRPRSFWMKNTYVPLSIAYADDAGIITNIEDMDPHITLGIKSSSPATYALEMEQGWFEKNGVIPGDKIEGKDVRKSRS